MSTKRSFSLSETRIDEHLNLLKQLEIMSFVDSCCDICHCDCYNSHHNESGECCITKGNINECNNISDNSRDEELVNIKVRKKKCASNPKKPNCTLKSKQISSKAIQPIENFNTKKIKNTELRKKRIAQKCSKSKALQRSQSQCSDRHYTRDCEILENLLTSIDDKYLANLEIVGKSTDLKKDFKEIDKNATITSSTPPPLLLPPTSYSCGYFDNKVSGFMPVRLSECMANLCLAPTIKEAYNKVPDHDKRILNRMATKRSEKAVAKDNAWLARKYWENERYERELLKCEQMEEYKKAVRDKQFQDYLETKARLNDIAQKDLAELQRLRESLQQKDDRTKKRLQCLRNERDVSVNQKRNEEMRKIGSVNLYQEEQNLDEMLRKTEACQRLTERLQRADHIRNKMLENYLKRLRYDNYIQHLQHEEHLREVQLNEQLKRDQLKERISRKRCRSQHFVEKKQQRNESMRKTAKLSKSLRDIVRASVTPEVGVSLFGTARAGNIGINARSSVSDLILNRPF